MTDVLVTGATGFVGSHVVEALRGRVHRVRAVVRPTSDTTKLQSLGVELCVASLTQPEALAAAVQDADVVVHLAAMTHARTEDELQRVNGAGTGLLVDALAEAATAKRRFIYLSSLAAVGPSDGMPVQPDSAPRPLTAYGRSKLAGEVAVKARAKELETVILRAPAVYGPGDKELLRFFRLARAGVMPKPAGPERRLQMVHVTELARAIALAVTAPQLEGVFHIADDASYTLDEMYNLVGAAVGRPPVLLPVPGWMISAAAAVSEQAARVANRSTMFSREKVRELLAPGWLCETEGARQAFGFQHQIPLERGMRETAVWYRNNGWL